jgi:radical SAM superfamily enzyme YgiQ (UPF0313 family)
VEKTGQGFRVVLTADRTLMSDYHHNEFIGFGTCAPPNVIPDWLYKFLFFPPIKTNGGVPVAAPYGLRKIEAQLQMEGFDVVTVDPDHLAKYINEAKVLGIHVMDPFGLGPASSTFASILQKEPFLAQHFRELMEKPEIKRAKRRGLKIIVGGPGVWQFKYRQEFVEKHGIDCIIEGEAEKVIGKILQAALNNESLPQYYEVPIEEIPSLEEIPDIIAPSINALVEIGRGCCRGCKFCSVTLRPLRWYPYEKILREIEVNMNIGRGACLHAEDVMLYGSKNTIPDDEKLVKLHEVVMEKCDGIGWSHCSLAAVASKPKLFSKISEIILQKQSWWGAEVGIELVDDLKEIRSLIVPLFFVPMGKLKDDDWFKETEMNQMHRELLIKCLKHDFYWIDNLIDLAFAGKWYAKFMRPFYRLFVEVIKYKARKEGIK